MAKPQFNPIRSFLLHPGSWVLLALITLAIGLIITAAAPWLLVAAAPVLAANIVMMLGAALVSLFPYIRSYWIKLDTTTREKLINQADREIPSAKDYKVALWHKDLNNSDMQLGTIYVEKVPEKDKIEGFIFFNKRSILLFSVSAKNIDDLEKRRQFQNALTQPNMIEALTPLIPDIISIVQTDSVNLFKNACRIVLGICKFMIWLFGNAFDKKPHPWQVLFVSLGVMAFIVALVLTIGFFTGGGAFVVVGGVMAATGGGAFAFMGSVFAPIAGIFAASSIAAFTTPFCVAFMSGLLFTLAPLNLIANTPKRLFSFFGGLKDGAEDGENNMLEDGNIVNPNNQLGNEALKDNLRHYVPSDQDYYYQQSQKVENSLAAKGGGNENNASVGSSSSFSSRNPSS